MNLFGKEKEEEIVIPEPPVPEMPLEAPESLSKAPLPTEIDIQPSEEKDVNLDLRAEMDLVLAYKNLLAAEDHLREIMQGGIQSKDFEFFDDLLKRLEDLRSSIMPQEVDPRFHCITKHLCSASIALDEVAKNYHGKGDSVSEAKYALYSERGRRLLNDVLGQLWGHDIENCGRCKL